jgi:opacity protein-like surface antigen
MKKIVLTLLTSVVFAASAQAGETYSAKAPLAPAPCLWTWFAGGSGGYVDDIDNDMWTIHLGKEYKCPGSNYSHAIFLEVGWSSWDDSDGIQGDYETEVRRKRRPDIDFDFDIVPITLNYKYERQLTNNLNWYIGGGLGVAISNLDVDVKNDGGKFSGDNDETNFFAQLFVGLVWNVSESFEIFGGARWMYMDTDDSLTVGGQKIDIDGAFDDTIFYELGARFNF